MPLYSRTEAETVVTTVSAQLEKSIASPPQSSATAKRPHTLIITDSDSDNDQLVRNLKPDHSSAFTFSESLSDNTNVPPSKKQKDSHFESGVDDDFQTPMKAPILQPNLLECTSDTKIIPGLNLAGRKVHPMFANKTTGQKPSSDTVATSVVENSVDNLKTEKKAADSMKAGGAPDNNINDEESGNSIDSALKLIDSSDSVASWKKNDPVPYSALCKTFDEIEATTKRGISDKIFPHGFASLAKIVVTICPEYEGKELGIGDSILMKAVANATGRSISNIKSDCDKVGDLGTVAEVSKKKQMTFGVGKILTVDKVFATLKEISGISGSSSQAKKIERINSLLVNCKGSETKFLIRSLEGKLRIGLAEKTVLVAISHASIISNIECKAWSKEKLERELESGTAILKQVLEKKKLTFHPYSELPNYDIIIPALAEHGIKKLHEICKLTPGIPLKPMLAHPTKSLTEVLDRFENINFICEFKYDGERAQIHQLEDGTINIYSRNSENLSVKYPDIMQMLPDVIAPGVTSFVLDCEAVAWDIKKKCILPFQVLSTRKRKDVAVEDIQVAVCVYVFDILYLNGKSLITETLRSRKESLKKSFFEQEGKFTFAKALEASSVDEIQTFLDESVAGNCEGLMVKTMDDGSTYEPSIRSKNWLKVKKDYLTGIGDTLDLVVIGGYFGKGKRTGWYGGFLLACYDDDSETYQSICKVATGLTEENLKQFYELFEPYKIDVPPSYYQFSDVPNIRPDVWFKPVQVWEVKAADLSISPVHHAGKGLCDPSKGISLRFPRFIRVREDKGPEQATNAEQVATMYRAQNLNSASGNVLEDDF
ncbi:tRNA ligase [Physocladia obscura]|uniref:DNA ligase n=1 Tax=Physocladia obscura TaxID=109957 RepID=A0AAD5T8G0_9FUNG|nr:tRNA ligase [Physocladia obscura]